MSTSALRAAVTGKPEEAKDASTFPGMLNQFKDQVAKALPKHINADRMCRIALTAFRLEPKLGKCQPASVFAAVIQAAQLGLEPGLNGRAYLIPYGQECQLVPGWKGMLELANRTGRSSAWTGAVFDGDEFEYRLGDSPFLTHRPGDEDDPAKLIKSYAVGRVRGSDWPIIEVWSNTKVRKHFTRYNKVGGSHYAHKHWEMYARKVALLQVLKYLPSSPELETAMALDFAADAGSQNLTIDGVLSNALLPTPEPVADEVIGQEHAGQPAYADLMVRIDKATKSPELDEVEDVARTFEPLGQRKELQDRIAARRLAFGPPR